MLLKNSVIYVIGRIIPSALNFALLALYTRLMGKEEYGRYAIVVTTGLMAFYLGAMWLNMAALRLYAKYDDKKPFLWALFVGFCAIFAVGAVISAGLAVWDGTHAGMMLILLGFLLFIGTAWVELNLHIMMAQLDAMAYVFQNIARTALGGALGGFLAWQGWGAEGALAGTILGLLIPIIPTTFRLWKGLSLKTRHPDVMRDVLAYGIPLSMTFTLQSLVNVTDRYVIEVFDGIAAFGLYAVGFDLADRLIRALSQPLGAASLPLAVTRLEQEGPESAREQCGQNLVVLLLLALPTCLGLIAVAPYLVDVVVGEEFRDMAKRIVPIIAFTSIFMMVRGNYLDHALHLGLKPQRQLISIGVMAVINTVLCIVLVRRYGPVGAAYATLVASFAGVIVSYFVGQTVFRLPLMPGQVARIVFAALVMMAAAMYLPVPGGPLAALLAKSIVGAIVYASLILAFDVGGFRQRISALAPRATMKPDQPEGMS